jgi:hypothetical protein
MSKLINYTILVFLSILMLLSCNKPPELPVIPSIDFNHVSLVEADGADSLIVYIDFKDGDGDLGLNSDEQDNQWPYEPFDVVFDENNDTVKYGSRPGLPPYNPIDYVINRDNSGNPIDTFLVTINPNHYNYFIHFFEKKNGKYKEFNWQASPYYQTFDGRFPLLNTSNKSHPLEGSLRYGMVSSGWQVLFRDTMKISVQIQDRALHKSNVVESPDFLLENIKTR